MTQHHSGTIGEIGMVCLYLEQQEEKNDRELCVALWYKKMSKYDGNGCEVCSLWYVYVPMMSVGGSSNKVFHKKRYGEQWLIY